MVPTNKIASRYDVKEAALDAMNGAFARRRISTQVDLMKNSRNWYRLQQFKEGWWIG